jgi:hypothetical protein
VVRDDGAGWVVTDGGIESLMVAEEAMGSPAGTGTSPGGVVVAVVEGVAVGAVTDEGGVVVVDAVRDEGGVVVGAVVSGARWSPGANPPMSAVVDDTDSCLR